MAFVDVSDVFMGSEVFDKFVRICGYAWKSVYIIISQVTM